jgi:hypothetical protein
MHYEIVVWKLLLALNPTDDDFANKTLMVAQPTDAR